MALPVRNRLRDCCLLGCLIALMLSVWSNVVTEIRPEPERICQQFLPLIPTYTWTITVCRSSVCGSSSFAGSPSVGAEDTRLLLAGFERIVYISWDLRCASTLQTLHCPKSQHRAIVGSALSRQRKLVGAFWSPELSVQLQPLFGT